MDYNPINPRTKLTRGERFRDAVARTVIRPTSAATGEQLLRLEEGAQYDYGEYGKHDFNTALEKDMESRQKQSKWREDTLQRNAKLDASMQTMRDYDENAETEGLLTSDPRERSRINSYRHRNKLAQNALATEIEQNNQRLLDDDVPSFGAPRLTSKSITLAALLGKRAVNNAFSREWGSGTEKRDSLNNANHKKPRAYYDDGARLQSEYTQDNLAKGKATHVRQTRNLSRIKRLKERIAPYRVAAYELSDKYGGREEGGWTYEQGDLVHQSRPFMTKRGAESYEKWLQREGYNRKDKRSILNMSPDTAYMLDVASGSFDPVEYTDNTAEAFGMPSRFIETPQDEDFNYSHFGNPSEDYETYIIRGNVPEQNPSVRPFYS